MKTNQHILTQSCVRELLSYEPSTGIFEWRDKRAWNARSGDVAGSVNQKGYWRIRIGGKQYQAHRLAWLYMTGEWPASQLDHINLNKLDNRFCNLRLATSSQNTANCAIKLSNTSGFKGVTLHKQTGKWQAACRHKYIGLFDSAEDAHSAYVDAAKREYGHFARAE